MDNRTKNYVEVDGNVLPGSLRGVIELFDEIVETIKGLKPGERKVVYFELVENKSLDHDSHRSALGIIRIRRGQ